MYLRSICKTYLKGTMAAAIVLFSSCYQPVEVITPKMSVAEMVPVLCDIHLAEALLTEVTNKQEKDSLARLYYAEVFILHQVDTAAFDQSMHAYMSNPAALDSLYSKVMQALNDEKASLADQAKSQEGN